MKIDNALERSSFLLILARSLTDRTVLTPRQVKAATAPPDIGASSSDDNEEPESGTTLVVLPRTLLRNPDRRSTPARMVK